MDRTHNQVRQITNDMTGIKASDYYDFSLLAVVVVLMGFGLIMLYSTTAYTSKISLGNDMEFFRKQGLIDLGCMVMAIVISRLELKQLRVFIIPVYIISICMMFLVLVPGLRYYSHGAYRWIRIGPVNFQPSEAAKIAVILMLSECVMRMGTRIGEIRNVGRLILIGAVPALIAWRVTNNLSTAIIIMAITAVMIFLAHPKTLVFILIACAAALAVWLFIHTISTSLTSSDNFRIQRILTWLHPEEYADGEGYQTMQALYAIGSGGFFGRGFGNSIQKLGSIPEAQNDMIFSIVCEELGIFGAIILLSLFGYMLYRMEFIARHARDAFDFMLVSGVFIHISLQVILNIAVVLNLMPNTGVTLPFISYGGTSIVFLMGEIGLVLNVSRHIRYQDVNQALL